MALVLLQLGFETLEQREGICRCAGKTGQHLVVVQLAHLACRALDNDVAQRDLPVPTDGDLHTRGCLAAHTDDGGSVK
ncbi:hypothetical protein D9M69_708200 [compost metagenome]